MPFYYRRHLKTDDWWRSDLVPGRGRGFSPAIKHSRVSGAEGEDGDEMLFRRRAKPRAAAAHTPLEKLPEGSMAVIPNADGSRYPEDLSDRLRAALLATGAEYAVALDNGLLPFACQPGQGQRIQPGATFWSVNAALARRTPTYPRLSTSEGRSAYAHNPEGTGVVVADDVFVWSPEPGDPPSEWRAIAGDYLGLDLQPMGLPVVLAAIDVGSWGGVAVLVRLVEELCALGANAKLVHAVRHRHQFRFPYSPVQIPSAQWKDWSDRPCLWVSTNWWSSSFAPDSEGIVHAAMYQDCESRFRNKDDASNVSKAVADRYTAIPNRMANSPHVVDMVREDHGVADMPWIPIGIDLEKFSPGPKAAEGEPLRIIALWRPVTPRRGHARLNDVYKRLKAKYGDRIRLEVFGETHPAPECVDTHHGWLSEDQVAEVMRGADLTIEASDFQGWGMVAQQSLSVGSALVSTRCGGPEAFATHGFSAWFVEHDDLFEGVCRVIDDKVLREALQKEGPEAVAATAWPKVAARWLEWLEGLAKTKGWTLE